MSNSPDNGNYIIYGINNETPYNAFFDVFSVAQNANTDIEWDTATIEGLVQAPWHFGDNDWHCWDTLVNNLVDIDCP